MQHGSFITHIAVTFLTTSLLLFLLAGTSSTTLVFPEHYLVHFSPTAYDLGVPLPRMLSPCYRERHMVSGELSGLTK